MLGVDKGAYLTYWAGVWRVGIPVHLSVHLYICQYVCTSIGNNMWAIA